MAIKFEVPKHLWTNTYRTRAYKKLKGRSKNFNEEFRVWCNEHNGTIMWSQQCHIVSIDTVLMDSITSSIPSKFYYDTWVVYFDREEDAMLFKLTWL